MADSELDVSIEPRLRGGAWADWWKVSYTRDGFTIDFGVFQPYAVEQVLVVSRIHLPWRGPAELIEDLERAWREFAETREDAD